MAKALSIELLNVKSNLCNTRNSSLICTSFCTSRIGSVIIVMTDLVEMVRNSTRLRINLMVNYVQSTLLLVKKKHKQTDFK